MDPSSLSFASPTARDLARQIAWARVGLGVGLLLLPRLSWRLHTGRDLTEVGLLRTAGVRDLGLALGAVAARDDRELARWALAGAAADAVDAIGCLARDRGGLVRRTGNATVAGLAAACGVWAARRLS